MKRCPTCLRAYPDETLRFCLEDGTTLVSDAGEPTVSFDARQARTEEMPQTAQTLASEPRPTGRNFYATSQPPKTQNTALVVGLTIVSVLILLALGGVGAWFFLRSDKTDGTAQTQLNQNQNQNTADTGDTNLKKYTQPNANAAPSPVASASPSPVDVAAVREQVSAVLNGWASASRAHDLDKHLSYYADTLDTYYNASNVSASRVRSDRSRAYKIYTTLDVELSNMKITPDPAGEKATATFDKTWTFEGSEKYSSGSVHQKIWLTKIGGRWRITGEKDLQVYYVNNNREEVNSR
jgi:hypothetical protein